LKFFNKYLAACPPNLPLEEALTYFLEIFDSKFLYYPINELVCEGNQGIPNLLTTPKFLSLLIETNIKEILAGLIKHFAGPQKRKDSDHRLTMDSIENPSEYFKDSIVSKVIKIIDKVYFKNDGKLPEGNFLLPFLTC
jgi:hypothetical protein